MPQSSGGAAGSRPEVGSFRRMTRTLAELSAHGAIVIAALGLFHLVRWVLEYFSGSKDPKLFDKIPIRYIFDGADLCLLMGFLVLGVYFALKAYRGKGL